MTRSIVLAALCASACTIDVSLEDKRCPCVEAEGWVCDHVEDRCVRQTCTPAVSTSGLTARWATPNQILWTWEIGGEPSQFLRYEMIVAESKEDLRSNGPSVRIADSMTNPELAVPGTLALVRDLDPGKTYYASVAAFDATECRHRSDVVAKITPPAPQGDVEIFHDAVAGGGAPRAVAGLSIVSDAAGGAHLEYVPADDPECVPDPQDAAPTCGQPIGVSEMSLDVSRDDAQPQLDRVSATTFSGSFLELAVSSTAPIPLACDAAKIHLACSSGDRIFELGGFYLPSTGAYETVQLPLSAFVREGGSEPLTYDDIDAPTPGCLLEEVFLSCRWHQSSTVRIDDIVIRY